MKKLFSIIISVITFAIVITSCKKEYTLVPKKTFIRLNNTEKDTPWVSVSTEIADTPWITGSAAVADTP
jgi:hypothetical protein